MATDHNFGLWTVSALLVSGRSIATMTNSKKTGATAEATSHMTCLIWFTSKNYSVQCLISKSYYDISSYVNWRHLLAVIVLSEPNIAFQKGFGLAKAIPV